MQRNMQYFAWIILLSITQCNGDLAQCDRFDKDLPKALKGHQMVYFDELDCLYIFGGQTDNTDSSAIYKWDQSISNGWFEIINATTPETFWSYSNNVVAINNKAYFIGIYDGTYHSNIYIFDALNETFTQNTNLSQPCLSTNNTHIFMIGGVNDGNKSSAINYLQIYDVDNNEWYIHNITINDGFSEQNCLLKEDSLFVFGGVLNKEIPINHYYEYDISQNIWSYLGNKSSKSSNGAAVYYNSEIYVIGGWDPLSKSAVNVTNIIDIFSIEQQTINTNYMIDAVGSLTSLFIGDALYIFGGYNGKNAVSTVQVCNMENNITGSDNSTLHIIIAVSVTLLIMLLICIVVIKKFRHKRKFRQSAVSIDDHYEDMMTVNSK